MRIYEYGKENPECILLIHPSLVTWDYFEYVIPLLDKRYHLRIRNTAFGKKLSHADTCSSRI